MQIQSLPGNALAAPESSALRPFVETAFRFRRLWIVAAICVVLLSIIYTALTPRQYRSEMEMLVQNNRGDNQITAQPTAGSVMVNGVTEEQINSEVELLRSRSLADVVVDPQWTGNSASTMKPDQLHAHEKAVAQFSKDLSVEMIRRSNVIHITYTASDPHKATETLSRLMNAFLVKQREIAQPPGTAEFFASEAARYKSELDKAQQELAEFQQQHQMVSLGDSEQARDREINDAETQLRATDAQISETSQRTGTEVGQLKSIPDRQQTQERTLPNDYSVERLNTMLAELQNKRTTLLTKFTAQDRLVQETDKQIADTKTALTNARQMTSSERSTDVNPVWQAVTGSIIHNQTERQALKARHDALEEQIGKLKASLSTAEGSTVAFSTLRLKVADLQSSYELYAQKSNEAKMEDAMNENRLLNVAVAQSPTFAITPFRPKPAVDIILGCFTAIFFASFMVFFAEMGRTTIATPREADRLLRFSLLATVPNGKPGRGRHTERITDGSPVSVVRVSRKVSEGEETARRQFIRYPKEPRAS